MGMLKNKWFWVAVVVAIVLYISVVKKKGPLASMFGTDSYDGANGEKDSKTPIKKGPGYGMPKPRPLKRKRMMHGNNVALSGKPAKPIEPAMM